MDIFSEVEDVLIVSYTRKQAIADGVLIDITETAIEAGFKYPVAVTHAVWNQYIVPSEPLKEMGQSVQGRLWDMLMILRYYSLRSNGKSEMFFDFIVLNEEMRQKKIRLKSMCHPGDNLEPVITIMMPNED